LRLQPVGKIIVLAICLVTLGVAPQQAIAQDCQCRSYAAMVTPIDYAPSRGLQVCFSLKVVVPEPAGEGEWEAVLDCLAYRESTNNPDAYNPRDTNGEEAIGLLQFHRGTFVEQCVDRFGFADDIWDPEIQRSCAIRILDDGGAWRWPPIKYCL
jgi:hypothetical protein